MSDTSIEELIDLERGFWTGNAAFYRDNLDDHCLTAFAEMAGVFDKDDVARMVGEAPRWRDVELAPKGLVQPAADFVVLTYEASAARGEGERYRALVSSGYVKRPSGWKMAFHQQTPLVPAER